MKSQKEPSIEVRLLVAISQVEETGKLAPLQEFIETEEATQEKKKLDRELQRLMKAFAKFLK